MEELGADRTFVAPIRSLRFQWNKYKGWLEHKCRGTALDWIVSTANSAELPEGALELLGAIPVGVIHINHVFTLKFGMRLARRISSSNIRMPIILETHDIQAHTLQQRKEINPWTHQHDTLEDLVQSELAYLEKMRILVHCSVDDCQFFRAKLPGKQHVLALPTIDESLASRVKTARKGRKETIDLLFVGQSTEPNRLALKWFFEKVWPLISRHGYRVEIIGQIDRLVQQNHPDIYGNFRSCFTGSVADLTPFYCAARCVIAPMISGTGISVKTIEALAMGMPLVGTTKAFRGMPMDEVLKVGLRPHNTPEEFGCAIIDALSPESRLGEAGRALYDRIFSKEASFRARQEALELAFKS